METDCFDQGHSRTAVLYERQASCSQLSLLKAEVATKLSHCNWNRQWNMVPAHCLTKHKVQSFKKAWDWYSSMNIRVGSKCCFTAHALKIYYTKSSKGHLHKSVRWLEACMCIGRHTSLKSQAHDVTFHDGFGHYNDWDQQLDFFNNGSGVFRPYCKRAAKGTAITMRSTAIYLHTWQFLSLYMSYCKFLI